MLQENKNTTQSSSTAVLLDYLALHRATPSIDDVDHRELPTADETELAIQVIFETTSNLLIGSQLEPDTEEMLWSITNIFHRRLTNTKKCFDDNDIALREMLQVQDGSEVKSVELEKLQDRAAKLWDHTSAYENMRDIAAQCFSIQTGSTWFCRKF